jgi:phosphodiesterase/alkaline phosphatase D-like protein
MKKTLLILLLTGALSTWSIAQNQEEKAENHAKAQQAKDNDASNPNGNVTITSGPTATATQNSATISWQTSGNAASNVRFGTDSNNLNQHKYQRGGAKDHSVTLSNLQPGTTYFFAILSDDSTVRTTGQFQTQGTASAATATTPSPTATATSGTDNIQITSGPAIANTTSNTATLTWQTDKPSASEVLYGPSTASLSQQAFSPGGSTTHSVQLTNLQSGQTYFYEIVRRDKSVRQTGSFVFQPNTASISTTPGSITPGTTASAASSAVQIVGGPVVETVSPNSATIAWKTNVQASSLIHYGTLATGLSQTAEAGWGGGVHRVQLSNLSPNTTYFFQVESSQAQGTGSSVKSPQAQSFQTLAPGTQAKVITQLP